MAGGTAADEVGAMSEPIGICSECGGHVYGNYSVHDIGCMRGRKTSAPPADIRSAHRDAPDCNCIACAIERGRDDS